MISRVSFIGMLVYISLISRETNLDYEHKGITDNDFVNCTEFFILYLFSITNFSCRIFTNCFLIMYAGADL